MKWFQTLRKRLAGLARKEAQKEIEQVYKLFPQLLAFHMSPPEQRQDFYDHTKDPLRYRKLFHELADQLRSLGVTVRNFTVDLSDFARWLREFAPLVEFYRFMGASQVEKCLEHYVAYSLLSLRRGDTYLDVGAKNSPWASLLRQRGIQAFRLDTAYSPGRHGIDIGADACATMLPPNFADGISLQCAYNCFAGTADIRFLSEAFRVLKPHGKCVITPLCLDKAYYCTRSPYCDLTGFESDPGALCVWRTDEYRLPFTRTYSPKAFHDRVWTQLPSGLSGEVLYLTNWDTFSESYPGQRVYGCFHLLLTKRGET